MTSAASRPYPPPMPVRRTRKPFRRVDVTVLVGGALMLLAAAMPWITATDGYGRNHGYGLFHTSTSGWDVLISAGLAVVLGGAAMAGARSVLLGLAAVAAGAYSTYLGSVHFQAAQVRAVRYDLLPAGVDIDPGAGAVLMVMAGVLVGVAGAVAVCRVDPAWPRLRRSDRVALLGGLFVVVAPLLPWATQIDKGGRISHVSSWDDHGELPLVFGVGVAAMVAVAVRAGVKRHWAVRVVPPLLGVVAVWQAVELIRIVRVSIWLNKNGPIDTGVLGSIVLRTANAVTDPGAGLFALVLGGGLLLVSAMVHPPLIALPPADDEASS